MSSNICENIVPTRKKIFTVLLVLMPILNQYTISKLWVMDIIALVGIVFFLLSGHSHIKSNYAMILYIGYIIIDTILYATILHEIKMSAIMIRIFRVIVLYTFFFLISDEFFSFEYAFRVYSKVVYAATAVIIFQFFVYITTRIDINFLIPGMTLNYGDLSSDALMHSWHSNAEIGYYRPCSFFLEPAHHAQFCLPWLAMALFISPEKLGKHSLMKLFAVTVGICTTTSTLGILCSVILWVYCGVVHVVCERGNVNKAIVVFTPVAVLIFIWVLNSRTASIDILYKLSRLASGQGGSTTYRLLRGFACFQKMPFISKLFGCGYGNLFDFFTKYNITTVFDDNEIVTYMNAASTLLCYVGIVGVFLYLLAVRRILFENMNYLKCSLLICFFIIMFTSSLFDAPVYFLIILFLQQLGTVVKYNSLNEEIGV